MAKTVDLTCTEDAYIRNNTATTNYGSTDPLIFGNDAAGSYFNVLFNFDVTPLPPKMKVISACLVLWAVTNVNYRAICNIRLLLRNWVESQVTWNVYSTGNSWATAGGLGAADSELLFTRVPFSVAATARAYQYPLSPKIIEAMRNGTGFGVMIPDMADIGGDTPYYSSRENGTPSQRPFLRVIYEPYHKVFPISAGLGQVR